MTERKPIRSEEELAEAFDQLFSEIPSPQSQEEINDFIREAGINPDEFGVQIKELAVKALQTSPYNWRNKQAQAEIEEAGVQIDKIEKIGNADRLKLLDMIDNIVNKIKDSNPQFVPVHYRNKLELPEEDLASLLQELVFIAKQENIEINLGE
ncbi:MAG: hypothetical protein DWQ07_25955 [Chloroflexi bacterium]|nr:MAG: hypothetical protein DWQ07_25955 [Chloroflexota bacterium]